ncbi:lipoprotein [Escherichia coli]|nr:lipoprotein [Escherichia coli]
MFPGKSFFSAHEVSTCKISGCLSYRILDSGPDGTQTTLTFYMKAFNKLFSLVVASVLVFSLAGCGDKEESKKFSANLNGTEIAITYVYKGDKVLKQSSETKIQFASIGATTKEDAAKTLEPLSAKYKNIAGVEEKLTYTDTYAQENVTIDMEKVDFKALQGISGINVSAEDAKKGITMAQMELVMKAAGFKEVK